MVKRRLTVWVVGALGVAAVLGCQDLNYDCVGVCGLEGDGGVFAGIIAADSEVDAINMCLTLLDCDGGVEANCNCYLSQVASRGGGAPSPSAVACVGLTSP